MQDWHESFCRTTRMSGEPMFDDEILDDDLQIEKNGEDEEIELPDADDILEEDSLNADHEFVRKLSELGRLNPIRLHPRKEGYQQNISTENVEDALQRMPPKRTRDNFVLPGRAKTGLTVQESHGSADMARLDGPNLILRIDLMENLLKALRAVLHFPSSCKNADPVELDEYFPTIQEQSTHWTLNEKQHAAFTLISAALLKHIWLTNEMDPSMNGWQHSQITQEIKTSLQKIFNTTEQLVLFLGGSGGTGKSRVIQAFVDFARRWHSSASIVITASSGIAAVLIGGCTLHCALGIQVNMDPIKPSQSQREAWSEVGILFLDEFSMVSQELFDLLNRRLKQLKDREDQDFGGVNLILT